ncbi:peptidoglycan-binding domain-containing protein [Leptolyngbya ohadii]|uniref:peptidoglycan-binding domain-containing protein n=1 Tax=Leptolyngbya ohadii TaxID=1962290 RepID=UPI0019D472AF|nr:peptidoglycan-binding domain-containing protein [Leptolyngbya ohadii]
MSSFLRQGFLSLAVMTSVVGVSSHTLAQTLFPSDTLFPGDSGANVFYLQQLLRREGFFVSVDGRYGSETTAAVTQFQRQCGLIVDGIAGPQTITSLTSSRCSGLVPIQPELPIGNLPEGPFVAVVPGDDLNTLRAVQQVVPAADIVPSSRGGRGAFISAGGYRERDRAEAIVNQLRDRRVSNARVEFRP